VASVAHESSQKASTDSLSNSSSWIGPGGVVVLVVVELVLELEVDAVELVVELVVDVVEVVVEVEVDVEDVEAVVVVVELELVELEEVEAVAVVVVEEVVEVVVEVVDDDVVGPRSSFSAVVRIYKFSSLAPESFSAVDLI
jgi:hypothetical protein